MTPAASLVPAPGARVVIRDAEWVVRRVDMIADGAYQLVCDGVSELVREQEAVYGQPRTPLIVYLVTESANATIRGDTRILEVLERKDEQAYRNVGDPSAFMNVHDIREEEKVTERAIADGETASHFDQRLTPGSNEGDDLLALFLGTSGDAVPASDEPPDLPPPPKSLYESDLRYCEAALTRLQGRSRTVNGSELRFEANPASSTLTLDAPEDLRHRFGYFPREIVPENWRCWTKS